MTYKMNFENVGRILIGGFCSIGVFLLYMVYTPFGVWFSIFVGGVLSMALGWIIKPVGEVQKWRPEEE